MLLPQLAFRNIFRQKRRSLLTVLSMSGGYLLCVLSISLSEGIYNSAIRFFTTDHTGHVQIHQGNYHSRPRIHKTIIDLKQLSATLDANKDIEHHTLRAFAPALAYSGTENANVRVIGVDLSREKKTSRLAKKVTRGQYINAEIQGGRYRAMVGAGVARALDISIDDEIILISQGFDGSIANDIFIVGAIIGKRDSMDKFSVFLPLEAVQDFLSMPDRAHEVAILLKDASMSREVAASLQKQLVDLRVLPWQTVEAMFYRTMRADQVSMNFMLGIIIFIVFVGVLNTVLMSILERTREFGVLKAIGSRPRTIAALITLETVMLSVISILVGLVFAIPLIIWFTYMGFELPEPVDIGGITMSHVTGEMSIYVFGAPTLAIIVSALIVSVPSGIRAGRISPTEAMRSY